MTLNNFFFLIIFAVILFGYWLLAFLFQKKACRRSIMTIYLLLCSYAIVAISDIRFLICVAAITVIAYLIPLAYKKNVLGIANGWIRIGVIANLLFLGVFKYFNFFYGEISALMGRESAAIKIILPIGISFYTFSAISYIVDVWKNKIGENTSFCEVALYVAFFPKLMSGPIVRAKAFFEQLSYIGNQPLKDLEVGIQIFVYGCFKKMVLADHIGVFVDQVYHAPSVYHTFTVILATIGYSLQIYFDFAGYSDMAIGISKILGFNFDWNFNFPYLSKNLTEFWKRWHISLSSWLQEYLYYSLGGNRKGKTRTYVNLVLTMVIGGLWHGAAWTFIVWGFLHGIALMFHKLFMNWKAEKYGDKFYTTKVWNVTSVILTFLYANFCWIWFRASSFENAMAIIIQMVIFHDGIIQPYTWVFFGVVLLIIMTMVMWKKRQCNVKMPTVLEKRYILFNLNTVKGLTIFFVLCGLTFAMAYYGNTVFIYGAF